MSEEQIKLDIVMNQLSFTEAKLNKNLDNVVQNRITLNVGLHTDIRIRRILQSLYKIYLKSILNLDYTF